MESHFQRPFREAYRTNHIGNEEILKLFEHPDFHAEYGCDVDTILFSGMNIATIAKIARAVKAKRPTAEVYVVTSLTTENSIDKNIWHQVMLTEVTDDAVVCHDPTPAENGAPDRVINKQQFLERWAGAMNTGYIVIAA